MQVTILLTFILIYGLKLLDAAETQQDKAACRKLIKANESFEECVKYLGSRQKAKKHQDEIIQKFIEDNLSFKSVKDFYTRVIEVPTYKCTGGCVVYLMQCLPLDQMNDWDSVLQFVEWEFLATIIDTSDETDGSLCRNILHISRKPENKKYLDVLYERNNKHNICRANFQIIAEIAALCNGVTLEDDTDNFKDLFAVEIITDMCRIEDKWEFDAFKMVMSETFATKQRTRIKFTIVLEISRKLKNKTTKYINENITQILDLIPLTEFADTDTMYNIFDTFNYLKVDPGKGIVKKFLATLRNNTSVLYEIVRCIYEVEASVPYQRVNWDTYLKFKVLVDFFHEVEAGNVCKILVQDWNVKNSRILFDVLFALLKAGYNSENALGMLTYVPKDYLLYKHKKTDIMTHVRNIQLMSYIILNAKNDEWLWPSLSKRKMIPDDFLNIHFHNTQYGDQAIRVFFSDDFERVENYKSCPISIVVEIFIKYDRLCLGKLSKKEIVDLVNLRWKQENTEEGMGNNVLSNMTSNTLNVLSYINMNTLSLLLENQIRKLSEKINPVLPNVDELLKNYNIFTRTILLGKFSSPALGVFLEIANRTGLDDYTILNLAFREDRSRVYRVLKVINDPSWSNLGPSIVKLSDRELEWLPYLLQIFKDNMIPEGKWLKLDVARWLEFVRGHGVCLGAEVLMSNQNEPIQKIIHAVTEKEKTEKRDKILCGGKT